METKSHFSTEMPPENWLAIIFRMARVGSSVRKLVNMVMVNLLVNDLKPGNREQSNAAVCLAVLRK
jgi:hypothetical protein